MYVVLCTNYVLRWGMSYNVSCGEVCRAMSRHDIVCLHGTTWGVSCNVSCHEDKFGDVFMTKIIKDDRKYSRKYIN